jgi:16S rRNA processing protein RimM
MVRVGRVARAHGKRGEVIVNPDTDFPDARFRCGAVLYARRAGGVEPLTVTAVRFQRGRPIVALKGIDTIEAAESLAGAELGIPESELTQLPAGHYYRHDLVGCRVETIAGTHVGVVKEVEGEAETIRLVISGEHGDVLVPLAAEICREIDVMRRRILIAPPQGLLELNER